MLLLIYHLLKEFINNLPPRIIIESLNPGLFLVLIWSSNITSFPTNETNRFLLS